MDPRRAPIGDERELFQNNFAFGRSVRWLAQNIHPGYWQTAHRESDGYRLDQIMRYSEGNLPLGEKAEISREAVTGFIERVESAASKDPRGNGRDPMEPHRHRRPIWSPMGTRPPWDEEE